MAREFVLLGEVGIHTGNDVAVITQPRLRGLLAALLVDVNTVLSCETLVDRVWGNDLPHHPRASLRNHVARLRALLGDSGGDRTIVSSSGGYLLRADPDSVDLHRFRRLRDAGRGAEALALWSSEALIGVHTPWADELRAQLNAERLAVQRDLVVPRQLPAAPLSFVGRHDDLLRLDAVVGGGTMAISAIAGTGGVGKTWLALRWAHDNAERFPDGQLYAHWVGNRDTPYQRALAPWPSRGFNFLLQRGSAPGKHGLLLGLHAAGHADRLRLSDPSPILAVGRVIRGE